MANKHTPEFRAHYVDHGLVLSFFSKKDPELIHVDLGGVDSTHFFIKEGEDTFSLMLRRDNTGEALEIYAFDEEKEALEAFKKISKAMLLAGKGCPHKGSFVGKLVKLLLVLGIVYLLFVLFLRPTPRMVDPVLMSGGVPEAPVVQQAPMEEGQPVPLEELLQ